jgi:hypothetical protein
MGDRFDLVMPLAQQGGGGSGFEPFGSNNEYFKHPLLANFTHV